MEATALSVAKSVLTSGLTTLTLAISNEIGVLFGVEQELHFIKDELEIMQAFLRTTNSNEQQHSEVVSTWVKQIRELAYDVEDCLQESSLAQNNHTCIDQLNNLNYRHEITCKIRQLKARVEAVCRRNVRYGVLKSSTNSSMPSPTYQRLPFQFSTNEEALLVGLDNPKSDLIHLITQKEEALKVISVIGMSGIGKTTLVKKVYESLELTDEFNCFAWIMVLQPFNRELFLKELYRQLIGLKRTVRKESANEKYVRKDMNDYIIDTLKEKKYIIVLDDLSGPLEWTSIKDLFPDENKGSRIIVTTRSDFVGSSVSLPDDKYQIKTLSKENSLDLFFKVVFKNSYYLSPIETNGRTLNKSVSCPTMKKDFASQTSSLVEIGKQDEKSRSHALTNEMTRQANLIVERCGGLPLAVMVIGGFLSTKPKTASEWKRLHDHLSSELENNPSLGKIKTALTSSYDGLPYHLKSCLLYMSVFVDHHHIRQSRLATRWMAEGYLVERRDMTPKEVADSYFYELLNRSLIQPSEIKMNAGGVVDNCLVHDLMYELILSKSIEENLVFLLDNNCALTPHGKIRHLVISSNWNREEEDKLESMNLSHTRSLTIFGEFHRSFISRDMKLLRVLDLEGTIGLDDRDLGRITKLRHLRYLNLRGTNICKLPNSIQDLLELETLDVTNTFVTDLPRGINKLQRLRYIRGGNDKYELLTDIGKEEQHEKGGDLGFLALGIILVSCISKYMNILQIQACQRALLKDRHGINVPRGIGRLSSLYRLGVVNVGQGTGVVKELRKLTQLRKLGVTGLTRMNGHLFASAINELIHLKALHVRSSAKDWSLGCLDSIKSPPKDLRTLKLFGQLGKLPRWIISLENLYKLYLRSTELETNSMEVLARLPNLAVLYLNRMSILGTNLCFHHETFLKLKMLRLSGLKVESVTFEGMTMPILERLEVSDCASLCGDGFSGVEFLPNLKEISLYRMDYEKKIVNMLQEQLAKNPNHPILKVIKS